jgi:FtsH-binding integral membrane protein
MGALSLYLNFINLFMLMLRLAGVRFARRVQLVSATH